MLFGYVGLKKIREDLVRLSEQRAKEIEDKEVAARLKRTEFFLNQHRRLFDNAELYSVLCLIDHDEEVLRDPAMADKKRKFLTFFEEIELLVRSGHIDPDVAHYMFGYYAICVKEGKNFHSGINMAPIYWRLFYDFAQASENFRTMYPSGPPDAMKL